MKNTKKYMTNFKFHIKNSFWSFFFKLISIIIKNLILVQKNLILVQNFHVPNLFSYLYNNIIYSPSSLETRKIRISVQDFILLGP
jgi:hypothetical protein